MAYSESIYCPIYRPDFCPENLCHSVQRVKSLMCNAHLWCAGAMKSFFFFCFLNGKLIHLSFRVNLFFFFFQSNKFLIYVNAWAGEELLMNHRARPFHSGLKKKCHPVDNSSQTYDKNAELFMISRQHIDYALVNLALTSNI